MRKQGRKQNKRRKGGGKRVRVESDNFQRLQLGEHSKRAKEEPTIRFRFPERIATQTPHSRDVEKAKDKRL